MQRMAFTLREEPPLKDSETSGDKALILWFFNRPPRTIITFLLFTECVNEVFVFRSD